MDIYNYDYGVKFYNPFVGARNGVNVFFQKNTARLTYYNNLSFLINDPMHYQQDFTFLRSDIALINSKGVIIPVPTNDNALFDMVAAFLYSNQEVTVGNVVPITGANYILLAGDNGKTFLFDEPPSLKTFTITAGLPIGTKATVIKIYGGSSITFVGAGGMIPGGSDLTLNLQWSRMEVLVTGPTSCVCSNTGG